MNQSDLELAVETLRRGGVVGVPTDTVYGIAADPRHGRATKRLFTLKGRPDRKPVGLLVSDAVAAASMIEVPDYALGWVTKYWPGPLNLVGTALFELPEGLGDHARRTIGVRVPDHPVIMALLGEFGPLAVTSANRSGGPEALNEMEARAALGEGVDLYLPGSCPGAVSSTTVDVTGPAPILLRPGPLDLGL
ncbi:MAG: L-threonylcarbamoyladenylate synthase [Acidimicrobiia bacterium]